MGKKQKEQRDAVQQGSRGNHKSGGIAGRQNALAAKNEMTAADALMPGRHECLCQARIHELVLNCLGCGRVVCAQEGSGPCFTCGTLVCTRAEREIINSGTKKARELIEKLNASTISGIPSKTNSYRTATEFRDRLLDADADTDRRTKVNDLQSDYDENSPFLSASERELLKRRREELREMRKKEANSFVVSIDIDNGLVDTMKNVTLTDGNIGKDPVIQSILEKADDRRRAQEISYNNTIDTRWNPIGFIPRYLAEEGNMVDPNSCSDGDIIDAESLMIVSDELAAQITEEKGWSLALSQPIASFLANGLIRFVRWNEDLMLKGPLFIVARPTPLSEAEISKFAKKYVRDSTGKSKLDFTDGAILGRAFLEDCMLIGDFYEKFGKKSEIPGNGEYVLCFTVFEPLVSPVPHIPPSDVDVYEMDRQLKKNLAKW